MKQNKNQGISTLHLLLWANITVVSTFALATVDCIGWESGVALPANHLLTFVGPSQGGERWLNLDATKTTTTKSQDQMESGLLLNVVV